MNEREESLREGLTIGGSFRRQLHVVFQSVLQCVAVCCSVLQSHGSYISRVLCRDRTREKISSSRRDGKSSVIFLLYLKSCLH